MCEFFNVAVNKGINLCCCTFKFLLFYYKNDVYVQLISYKDIWP